MRALASLAMAALLTACSSSTGNPDVDKFNSDVGDQGIASSLVQIGEDNLGADVCTDLRSGKSADAVIADVAEGNISEHGAKIVAYYAITDICSDQMSQRRNAWLH